MRNVSFKEKLSYKVDKLMSKGTSSLVIALAIITLTVLVLGGVASVLVQNDWADGSIAKSMWTSLMYEVDAGALGGAEGNVPLLAIMSIVTLCGIFITSMLIGIINTGLESKLDNLRRGTSKVIESGHTVILGFNNSVYTILSELIIANQNQAKACIVVMGNEDKQVMEELIASRISDTKSTEIICRSGNSSSFYDLSKCSIETSKSIIVNENNDALVIKAILAVSNFFENESCIHCKAHISAIISEQGNIQVARIAGRGRAEILNFTDAIARILAHTCYEQGLSEVYTELFDFDGDEIYVENLPQLVGIKFGDILNLFEKSTAIGIKKGESALLNPSMDTAIEAGDKIILIAADDGISIPSSVEHKVDTKKCINPNLELKKSKKESLLILGYNKILISILVELDSYMVAGSKVKITSNNENIEEIISRLNEDLVNIKIMVEQCDILNREVLERLSSEGFEHMLILCDLEDEIEVADSKTLLILLHLRDIAQKFSLDYTITSEMLDIRDQELARIANVSDFVISSNITSLMISQISENRLLAPIFEDLLDKEGSEIYMKPAENYVKLGEKVNMFSVTYSAAMRGEIFIGYRKVSIDEDEHKIIEIITNPIKSTEIVFTEHDSLIVIAEEA